MAHELALPPPELTSRIGGSYDQYQVLSAAHRRHIDSLLPEGWSFAGKRVLDFGCGTGRTLAAYEGEADESELWGCDIHAPTIEWAQQQLSPPFNFFMCEETPPLAKPDAYFDLVYAMSVFTHLTDQSSAWLAELHRVLRPGGIAILSILGPAMAETILGRAWDERIGMAVIDLNKGWEIGGPSTLLAEWWIREHWGRGFDVVDYQSLAASAQIPTHDFVLLRKRDVAVTAETLERRDPADIREYRALEVNLELVQAQMLQLGRRARERDLELASEREDLIAERDRLLVEAGGSTTPSPLMALRRRAASAIRR
jgi:ubiquinone/menaquinone biosynthesis C-methylase UbiE